MGTAAKYFNEMYKKKTLYTWLLKITWEISKVYLGFIISLGYVAYIILFFRVCVDKIHSLIFFPDAVTLKS